MQDGPHRGVERRGRHGEPRQATCASGEVPRRASSVQSTLVGCCGGRSKPPSATRRARAVRTAWAWASRALRLQRRRDHRRRHPGCDRRHPARSGPAPLSLGAFHPPDRRGTRPPRGPARPARVAGGRHGRVHLGQRWPRPARRPLVGLHPRLRLPDVALGTITRLGCRPQVPPRVGCPRPNAARWRPVPPAP
jgi:hypothetical protein